MCASLGKVIQRGAAAQGALPQHDAVLQVRRAISQSQAAKIDLHNAAINTVHLSGVTVRICRPLFPLWPGLIRLAMKAFTPSTARTAKPPLVAKAVAMCERHLKTSCAAVRQWQFV